MDMVALLHSFISTWKVPVLLHKQAKWRFIVKVAVLVSLRLLQYESKIAVQISTLTKGCYVMRLTITFLTKLEF